MCRLARPRRKHIDSSAYIDVSIINGTRIVCRMKLDLVNSSAVICVAQYTGMAVVTCSGAEI